MADVEQSPAILLRKTTWSETSLIVTWLSQSHGAIRTMAKGARRPASSYAGKLDLLFQADIAFTPSRKSDLHALREVMVRKPFDARKSGSAGLFLAAYFAELSGLAAPTMHPAPEIYDLLVRGVDHLQTTPPSMRALDHFEKELTRILGVYDASGKVSATQAIASLYGQALPSRQAAVRFLH